MFINEQMLSANDSDIFSGLILVNDSDIFSGLILVKDSDNSCESRLREQLFCRNKLINPVLSVRKLQYDVLSFENRY